MEAIRKVDPKEYGLQDEQAQSIEQAFMPKIIERDGLKNVYKSLLTQEMSPELSKQAGDLRRMLVKVRTGIAEIHRTQKAFYLAAGRYVDAWKNKETLPVEQMEENLSKIEKHYENIEIERKAKLRAERLEELMNFDVDGRFTTLEEMSLEVWNTYLEGVKLQFNQKKELERKAEEEIQRIESIRCLHNERILSTRSLWNFVPAEIQEKNLGEITKEEWEKIIADAKASKEKEEAEQERIRVENEKLEREKKIAEDNLKKEREALEERLRKEKEESEKRLREEREAREKAEAKVQEQKDKERREKEAQEKAAKKQALAPDKDKLLILAREIKNMQVPEVRSGEAAAIIANTRDLLTKTANYIIEKAEQL